MRYGLGLDIGTSTTSAAVAGSGVARPLALGPGDPAAPVAVGADAAGNLVSGDDALRVAGPSAVVRDLKRRLGDPSPVLVAGVPHPPAALLAATVRTSVDAALREAGGERPTAVVLTYPAIWGPYRRERFGEVPALAGLDDAREVTEAEAIATYYGPEAGRTVVVYDLGAGTFDTAVLRFTGDSTGGAWEMLGTAEGADRVGGLAFDDVVAGMAATAGARLDALNSSRVKEALSSRPEVSVSGITLRQAEFERRIAPLLDPTLEAVHRALRAAGVRNPDAILLAGGSTRIPLVARRLEEEFGVPVRADDRPEHVAALGAALIAERLDAPVTSAPYGLTGAALEAPRPHLRVLGVIGLVLGLLTPLVVIIVFLILSSR